MPLIPLNEASWEWYFRLLFWGIVAFVPFAAVTAALEGLFYLFGVHQDVSVFIAAPVGVFAAAYVTLRVYRADPLRRRDADVAAALHSRPSAEGSRYTVSATSVVRTLAG
jgi:hypothetical protein